MRATKATSPTPPRDVAVLEIAVAQPLRRPRPQRRNLAHVLFALGVPSIVGALHAYPDRGAVAEQLAEPDRDRRGHRFAFAQYVIEMLARNIEKLRNLGLAPPRR